jgi:hypothetical protein
MYRYIEYSYSDESLKKIDHDKLSVKDFKKYLGKKTGIWTHPKSDLHNQTYRVYIKKENIETILKEKDIIDFKNVPMIKIILVIADHGD